MCKTWQLKRRVRWQKLPRQPKNYQITVFGKLGQNRWTEVHCKTGFKSRLL